MAHNAPFIFHRSFINSIFTTIQLLPIHFFLQPPKNHILIFYFFNRNSLCGLSAFIIEAKCSLSQSLLRIPIVNPTSILPQSKGQGRKDQHSTLLLVEYVNRMSLQPWRSLLVCSKFAPSFFLVHGEFHYCNVYTRVLVKNDPSQNEYKKTLVRRIFEK